MAQEVTIAALEDDGERVLAPRRLRRFYLFFVPLILSFVFCGAGGWMLHEEGDLSIPGILCLVVGFLLAIAYGFFETFFIGILPARCYLRWLRQRIDDRADAVVAADDPDA